MQSQSPLKIKMNWEALNSGSPEEIACFAALEISAYEESLTQGHDQLAMCVRNAPYLSAYHLAEWFAWNWWRLRWESRKTLNELSPPHEWQLSHCMSSIGGGYIWPNIQIFSDGKNINFITKPTVERASTPYRYIKDSVNVIPASIYENELDEFIESVIARLKLRDIKNSNLEKIWADVSEERQCLTMSQFRKIEALLGEDPCEVDAREIENFIKMARDIGENAGEEIAADRMQGEDIPNITNLLAEVQAKGEATNPNDRVRLNSKVVANSDEKAWRIGVETARTLREQIGVTGDAVSNQKLAELFGVQSKILANTNNSVVSVISASWTANNGGASKVLLRSKWETGRRFELARLLGDHLMNNFDEPLLPLTRTRTFRQKAQRAFAIEFLSPIHMVKDMLAGDYSSESQEDVAHYFNVSPKALSTLLVNNKVIDREELYNSDSI